MALLLFLLIDLPYPGPAVADALAAALVEAEVLDARELPFFLGRPQTWAYDWRQVRERAESLRGCPYLSMLDMLPSREDSEDGLALSSAYIRTLELRRLMERHHADELGDMIGVARAHEAVWAQIRAVRCGDWYVSGRRKALRDLSSRLAEWGGIPSPVPVGQFREVGP